MIRATYNEYLDRRRPEWVDAEMFGRVYVDKVQKLVEVRDTDIERVLDRRL